MAGWKDILRQVAPTIASALGTPLAGGAVKKLADVLLGDPAASQTKVEAALLAASPETLLKLKELDHEYEKFVLDHDINLEKLAADDRASARAREIALKDKMPAILAIILTVGFLLMLGVLVWVPIPDSNQRAFDMMLGSFGTAWIGAMTYYHGSSAGSARKTDIMSSR